MVSSLVSNRKLTTALIRREIAIRYKGSVLGFLWAVLNPVLMLAVYTFVFSGVFHSKWPGGTGSHTEFALVLFAGLMLFNLFSECVNRAPALILSNTNFVKRVVFPLEILPVVTIGSALFHLVISIAIWAVFYIATTGAPHLTLLYLPITLAPFLLLTLGACWLLAALGVYLRDVSQVVGIVVLVLMFLSPVFFPVDRLPQAVHWLVYLSPITLPIQQMRDVMMWGRPVDWSMWATFSVVAAAIAWAGFAFFQKIRRGFADLV